MILGKVAFLVGMIMQIVIRFPYRNNAKRSQPDREEQILLGLLSIGGWLLPFVYIFTNWLAFADYDAPLWVIVTGIIMLAAGLWLFWRSHKDLGSNWSPSLELQDEHKLVTHGVYQQVRHPMYGAGWLMMLAQAFLLSNWVAGLGGVLAFGLMYFLRIPKEERMMLQEFGEQYQQYMSKTGRIIPKMG